MNQAKVDEIKKVAIEMKQFNSSLINKGALRPSSEQINEYNKMREQIAELVHSLAKEIEIKGVDVNNEFERLGLTQILQEL